jgi:hypothetical protein
MKRALLWAVVLVAMFGTGALAQDLSGNWQGTLKAGQDLRVIFTTVGIEAGIDESSCGCDGDRSRREAVTQLRRTAKSLRYLFSIS